MELAIEYKQEEFAEVLIKSGLKTEDSDTIDLDYLIYKAIEVVNPNITELLLNTSDMNQSRLSSWLTHAASEGRPKVIDLLLHKGADINSINAGQDPSLVAASEGRRHGLNADLWMAEEDRPINNTGSNIETVKLLLEKGANVNITGGYEHLPVPRIETEALAE